MNTLLVTFTLDGGGDFQAVLDSYIKRIAEMNIMRGGAGIRTVKISDVGGKAEEGKVLFESGGNRGQRF